MHAGRPTTQDSKWHRLTCGYQEGLTKVGITKPFLLVRAQAPSRKQINYNFFSAQGSIPPILLKFTVGKNVRRIFVERGQHSSNIPFCPRSASHSKCFHVREEQLLSRENMSRLLTYPEEPCNVVCIDLLIYLW